MFERNLEVPEKEPADHVHAIVKAAIASIPRWWAAPGAELFSMVISSPIEKRREELLEDIVWVVRETAARVDDLQPEKLAHNDAFVSAVLQVARIGMTTHQQEKRTALRNALLNIALQRSNDEDEQHLFLRYIDELTPSHLRVLDRCRTAQAMQQQDGFNAQLVEDLSARGLLSTGEGAMHMVLAEGDGQIRACATGWGLTFLNFITDPLA